MDVNWLFIFITVDNTCSLPNPVRFGIIVIIKVLEADSEVLLGSFSFAFSHLIFQIQSLKMLANNLTPMMVDLLFSSISKRWYNLMLVFFFVSKLNKDSASDSITYAKSILWSVIEVHVVIWAAWVEPYLFNLSSEGKEPDHFQVARLSMKLGVDHHLTNPVSCIFSPATCLAWIYKLFLFLEDFVVSSVSHSKT